MTPNELRQAMARAFAEEAGKYEVFLDREVTDENDNLVFRGDWDAIQQFITERGIAAAMRAAAEHVADCDGFPPGTVVGIEFGKILDAECVFAVLGETT